MARGGGVNVCLHQIKLDTQKLQKRINNFFAISFISIENLKLKGFPPPNREYTKRGRQRQPQIKEGYSAKEVLFPYSSFNISSKRSK